MIRQAKNEKMTSQDISNITPTSSSLGEIATRFLISLPSSERLKAQQEVYKFVRWYGEKRLLNKLTAPEVANYADQITSSDTESAERLGTIKSFLSYAHKQGLTRTNLAVHLKVKVKKSSSKSSSSPRRSSQETILLTTEGYANLEAELDTLNAERPRIAEEIRKAASDKDIRENAPLEAAREHQGQVEARIRELESTLKVAKIINEKQVDNHKVMMGNKVVLQDLTSGGCVAYTLVDASEANPAKGKISAASPIGQALLGQEKGIEIEVKAPAGITHYQIQDIKHH